MVWCVVLTDPQHTAGYRGRVSLCCALCLGGGLGGFQIVNQRQLAALLFFN